MWGRKKKDLSKDPFYREKDALVIYLKCSRCGHVMEKRILKARDFVVSYEGNAAIMIDKLYVCDKCYNQIKVIAGFKRNYKPVYFEINGGEFITKEEYEEKEGGK
jgi:DNA-directed RNA polymerase subunit RPC12/RpoP